MCLSLGVPAFPNGSKKWNEYQKQEVVKGKSELENRKEQPSTKPFKLEEIRGITNHFKQRFPKE